MDRYVVSGSNFKPIRVWELETGLCIRTMGSTLGNEFVAITPDGKYVISDAEENKINIWDFETGQCTRTMEGHTGIVSSLAVAVNGKWAISGSWDKMLKVWDLEMGQCICTMEGYSNTVTSVAITPDSRYVVSGSRDSTVRVWRLIWELEFPDPVDWDEGVRPYLEIFLCLNHGTWTDADFGKLIDDLSYRGYGWVRPEGIRKELEKMTLKYVKSN